MERAKHGPSLVGTTHRDSASPHIGDAYLSISVPRGGLWSQWALHVKGTSSLRAIKRSFQRGTEEREAKRGEGWSLTFTHAVML